MEFPVKTQNRAEPLTVVIMAAGKGRRMGSELPKVLHELLQKPLLDYVIQAGLKLRPRKLVIITGFKADLVEAFVARAYAPQLVSRQIEFARQQEMRGTADAVYSAKQLLTELHGTTVIVSGDVPLIDSATLENLLSARTKAQADLALLSFYPVPNTGYGRICRDAAGKVLEIIEERQANPRQRQITECGVGIYAVDTVKLLKYLEIVMAATTSHPEFYLTDTIAVAVKMGDSAIALATDDNNSCLGINTPAQLAEAEKVLKQRLKS